VILTPWHRAFALGRVLSGEPCGTLRVGNSVRYRSEPGYVAIRSRNWGTEQGFPRGPVYAIAQTPDGYLWIGTEAGLVRFDGWNFRLVKDDSGAFTITSVLGLSDRQRRLFVAAFGRPDDFALLPRQCSKLIPAGAASYMNISAMNRAIHGDLLVWQMEYGAFTSGRRISNAGLGERSAPIPGDYLWPKPPTVASGWEPATRASFVSRGGATLGPIRNGLPDLKVNCLLPMAIKTCGSERTTGIVRWNGSELTSGHTSVSETFRLVDGPGSRREHLGGHGFARAPEIQLPRPRLASRKRRRAHASCYGLI
jgi:hypothetical protein